MSQQSLYARTTDGFASDEDRRLLALEDAYDERSRGYLNMVRLGWRCLEIGAGRGAMAAWLAQRVGADGEVVAVDLNLDRLAGSGNTGFKALRFDICTGPLAALGALDFDLVFARVVLAHLPGKQEHALSRMYECLRPGGMILLEDNDLLTLAAADRAHPSSALFDEYIERVRRDKEKAKLMGLIDFEAGRALSSLLTRAGFQDVHHEVAAQVVSGGSRAAMLKAIGYEATRRITANREGVAFMISAFEDPSFRFLDELHHVAWGVKPGGIPQKVHPA